MFKGKREKKEINEFVKDKVKKWYHKNASKAPHLAHSLVCAVHSIMAEISTISFSPTNLSTLRNRERLHPSIYAPLTNRFFDIKKEIENAVNMNNLGSFATAPHSYKPPEKKDTRKREREKTGGDDKNTTFSEKRTKGRSDPNKGVLVQKDTNRLTLPQELGLCADFVQVGFSCANPRVSCQHGKHHSWNALKGPLQKKIKEFATNTEGVTIREE